MKIAVVGATGLVGSVILKVLEERGFENEDIIPVASSKSIGKEIIFANKKIKVIGIEEAIKANCDYAIFSAGGNTSKLYAPLFAKNGCKVIDNSSAWRMDECVPLVVPEINSHSIKPNNNIIANPNCSTIQMVMALAPLHQKYKIKRIIISTYQSVTGTGVNALNQLNAEEKNTKAEMAYPYPIHRNLFPHGGDFLENGYTSEEEKLLNETRKIFNDNSIALSATVVRVPVVGGHSEAVNVEFYNDFELSEVFDLLSNFKGVTLIDNIKENKYPMPLYSENSDEVFVGRIRRDFSNPNTLNLWIVSDNLRKGAATNAIQIMEYMISLNK